MKHFFAALLVAVMLGSVAHAGPFGFGQGIGPAMQHGPYTGGHRYSYNVAYSYGLSFNAADSWRIDPFAYPAGIAPYRPYGRPILYRAFPINRENPPISVPGEDGLPRLVTPGLPPTSLGSGLLPVPTTSLKPVLAPPLGCAHIRIAAPAAAQVFVDKEQVSGDLFQTPALDGRMRVYTVRAKWTSVGREVEQFRVVGVKPGETAKVAFGTEAESR